MTSRYGMITWRKRPELEKWWNYCLDHSCINSIYKKVSDDIRVNRVHLLEVQGNRFRHMALMHDQVLADGRTDAGRLLDLDDGKALAYALDIDQDDSYRIMMESHAIKNVDPPSLNYEEALYLHNSGMGALPYINLVYARKYPESDGSSEQSKPFLDNIDSIFHYLVYWEDAGLNHTVWNTEQDLIRTVRDFRNYLDLLLLPNESPTIIDSDYLDNYLSAPKLYPKDIDGDDWHDKAVRFMSTLDENAKDHKRMDRIVRTWPIDFLGLVFMSLSSCFLTHNIEDLTFMESVCRFCMSAVKDSNANNIGIDSYQPGKLDPKLFDLLREYGASFVKPLLESVLCDMNPVEEKRIS